MSHNPPPPPADDFPAGQTGDMREVLLSPPTGAKPATASPGRWEPPTAQELAAMLPQYEIESMLGRGGMGAVYKGTQIALDRPVAIKILSNQLEDADASFAERFKNEAKAMAKLSHPGIVGVYDFGETAGGLLYIVMEFIEGTDVARMIAQQGRLHTEHAMAITAHVCDALAYAHERGIIHRDIKPANIMVGYDGVVKVADFGLAKMTQSQNSGLTQSGMAMGTLHYMAPEALMLGAGVDHRADIYAVGVMLYQMLTGKIPQGLFELPSLQVPGLDPRYDGIIGKALREDRELRYPTVLAMRHDLDAILTQPVVKVEPSAEKAPAALQTQARPQRPGGQPYRPPQKVIVRTEKKGSGLMWMALIAMAALAAWLYWNKTDPERTPQPPSFASEPTAAPTKESTAATTSNPTEATKDHPFVNSLGMKFVPVPGTKVLFCIHETRRSDYATFAAEVPNLDGDWKSQDYNGVPCGDKDDHPVVGVSWEDAAKFCEWLSKKDGMIYRLATDEEWSIAVGLGDKESRLGGATPEMLNGKETSVFPWEGDYPPRTQDRAGNYGDTAWIEKFPNEPGLKEYYDGFPTTAPAMSFKPNKLGLYDMGGNVWEWVADWWNNDKKQRVARGAAFDLVQTPGNLLASRRVHQTPGGHLNRYGFRCVLDLESLTNPSAKTPVVSSLPVQPSSTPVAPEPTTTDPPNTTRRVSDLLAMVDPQKNAFRGVWTRTPNGLSAVKGERLPVIELPHTPAVEYDLDVEFSITGDSIGWVGQTFRVAGKCVRWLMQGQPKAAGPVFGFEYLDGKPPLNSECGVKFPLLFAKGVRYRSCVKVRRDSLTGVVEGKELVRWQGDFQRFQVTEKKMSDSAHLALGADLFFGGGITFHKATIIEFLPQTATPALPTGPTTWTDTKGRTITATFKAIASGNVLLDIAGKVTPVPLNTLSAASQKLARDYQEKSSATAANDNAQATKDAPFTNSLGMKFVPVPGTEVLFCIHETRRSDYAAYAKEVPNVATNWKRQQRDGIPCGDKDDHPVVGVSWEDAQKFCEWLSRKEGKTYRLPTDEEWSIAVGLGHKEKYGKGITPEMLDGKENNEFPWGGDFPPKIKEQVGNYGDMTWREKFPKLPFIEGYTDGFATTAPVMSFKPNELGLYDMGGNVWEWVEDWWNDTQKDRVLRGAAFSTSGRSPVVSSCRNHNLPDRRDNSHYGFRCVLELPSSAASAATVSTPPMTAAPVATSAKTKQTTLMLPAKPAGVAAPMTLSTGPTTWTDNMGRNITATFKAVANGNVLLDIAGKVTPLPLNTLSAESQKLALDYQQQAAPVESDAASPLRELTKPKTADPSSLEQSILGLWWESFDGKDIPFYPLAFFADGTAGFGKYDSVPPINGKWTITGEKLALTWPNGCVYNIDLSKGTETRRTGQGFGGDDPNAEFSIKMVHTGVRPSASAVTHEDFAGQTFDFRYGDRFGDQGKDNSNGTIQLLYDGGVIQRSPMPITSWRVANGFLMFLDSRHRCLTLFGDLEKKDGKWHPRGQYLPMAKVKHWLVPE